MQHLDDGLLQAWLDRARSGIGTVETDAVESHLAGCAHCAARAEALRDLSGRTKSILSSVAPLADPVPDYRVVVARARAQDVVPRRPIGRRAVAWAASVAVAVGAGWMANDVYRRAYAGTGSGAGRAAQAPLEPPDEPARVAARSRPEVPEAEADSAPTPIERVAGGRPADVVEAAPPAAGAPAPDTWVVRGHVTDEAGAPLPAAQVFIAEAGVGALTRDDGSFALSLTETPSDSTARQVTLTVQRIGYGEARRELAARSGEAVVADFTLESAALALEAIVVTGASAGEWTPLGREGAEAWAGFALMTIPNLPLLSTEVAVVAGKSAVRVRQALGGGQVLTLVQRRGATSNKQRPITGERPPTSDDQPPATDSMTVASVRRNGLTVTATAPLPADSLSRLLDRLR